MFNNADDIEMADVDDGVGLVTHGITVSYFHKNCIYKNDINFIFNLKINKHFNGNAVKVFHTSFNRVSQKRSSIESECDLSRKDVVLGWLPQSWYIMCVIYILDALSGTHKI